MTALVLSGAAILALDGTVTRRVIFDQTARQVYLPVPDCGVQAPVNLTSSLRSCPVHHKPLVEIAVPIRRSLSGEPHPSESDRRVFPFGATSILDCRSIGSFPPSFAKVSQCSECVRLRIAWVAAHCPATQISPPPTISPDFSTNLGVYAVPFRLSDHAPATIHVLENLEIEGDPFQSGVLRLSD